MDNGCCISHYFVFVLIVAIKFEISEIGKTPLVKKHTGEWPEGNVYPLRFAFAHYRKATNTMKGPWESIACGREKGFNTQKLEKKVSHSQMRVGSSWRRFNCAAHFEENEGRPWADQRGRWYDSLREAPDGYPEGIWWWCAFSFVGWRQQHREEDVQVRQEASRF